MIVHCRTVKISWFLHDDDYMRAPPRKLFTSTNHNVIEKKKKKRECGSPIDLYRRPQRHDFFYASNANTKNGTIFLEIIRPTILRRASVWRTFGIVRKNVVLSRVHDVIAVKVAEDTELELHKCEVQRLANGNCISIELKEREEYISIFFLDKFVTRIREIFCGLAKL